MCQAAASACTFCRFALGNFLGPLVLGRFFDTVGRKPMISFTYAVAGCLLAVAGYLFWQGRFTSVTQTLAWSCVFFFASAGASAAYLTVSEIFPLGSAPWPLRSSSSWRREPGSSLRGYTAN